MKTRSGLKELAWALAVQFSALPLVSMAQDKGTGIAQTGESAIASETLILLRHGEKPAARLGQLTCQGLNRALALPAIMNAKFGRADIIFAPDPAFRIHEGDGDYSYVRPLATIEPTAIQAGLPVNTQFGYKEIDRLEQEVGLPAYWNKQVFIAWEHVQLNLFAKSVLRTNGGNPDQVPDWPTQDYDRIYVIKIDRQAKQPVVTFSVFHQGLNGLSMSCPSTAIGGR